jgi:hypothetical protein
MSAEVIQLGKSPTKKRRSRKARDGALSDSEFMFAVCQMLTSSEHERLQWVRQSERKYGFQVLGKTSTKKKSAALKLVE